MVDPHHNIPLSHDMFHLFFLLNVFLLHDLHGENLAVGFTPNEEDFSVRTLPQNLESVEVLGTGVFLHL